jgi:hypothetical protein
MESKTSPMSGTIKWSIITHVQWRGVEWTGFGAQEFAERIISPYIGSSNPEKLVALIGSGIPVANLMPENLDENLLARFSDALERCFHGESTKEIEITFNTCLPHYVY